MKPALWLAAALLSVLGVISVKPVLAGSRMETGAAAVPPAGFLGFCLKHLEECAGRTSQPVVVELTSERLRSLETVQATMNSSIRPREDPSHTWDYPTDGTGDCNRFALAKRRTLLAQGWPREAVLLATAITERGEGHLVVVARTDRGDLVLDNRLAPVVDWTALPYRWISIQSAQSPVRWLSILSRPVATAEAEPASKPAPSTPR